VSQAWPRCPLHEHSPAGLASEPPGLRPTRLFGTGARPDGDVRPGRPPPARAEHTEVPGGRIPVPYVVVGIRAGGVRCRFVGG
jgi:hypothetical protein